jgi:alkanesulfonate monooxygenase SsuD/methylene tetrahydromethanopterin reductase-like flavin-dependent oxidoreductase (luciferase family)
MIVYGPSREKEPTLKFNLMSLGDHITDPVTGYRPTAQQRHRAFVDLATRGEDAGFNGVNLGEHHGIEYIYSAPPVVLAAIAERTTRLRLGTAVTLLANLDALRVAEDYATLDSLSGGRVDVVSGRGNFFASTYRLFGHPLEESKERFAENAELLDELWKGKPVHWSGRFRAAVSGESLQPPPVQEAKDAMWIGGGSSMESVDLAARLGWKLMLPSAFGRPAFFEPIVDRYIQRWEEHGHRHAPEIGAAWHLFVAADSQDARARWEPRYRAYHEWMQRLLEQVNPEIPAHNARPFDFEWLTTEGPAIVGSPAEVTERIGILASRLHIATHLLYMDMGGMAAKELLEAIDLFGERVIPAFAGATAQQAASLPTIQTSFNLEMPHTRKAGGSGGSPSGDHAQGL